MVRLNHTDGEIDTTALKIPRQTLAVMKPCWFCMVDMHVVMIPNDTAKNETGKQRVNRVAEPVDGYLLHIFDPSICKLCWQILIAC